MTQGPLRAAWQAMAKWGRDIGATRSSLARAAAAGRLLLQQSPRTSARSRRSRRWRGPQRAAAHALARSCACRRSQAERLRTRLHYEGGKHGAAVHDDGATAGEAADDWDAALQHQRAVEKLMNLPAEQRASMWLLCGPRSRRSSPHSPRDAHDDRGPRSPVVYYQPVLTGCSQQRLLELQLLKDGHTPQAQQAHGRCRCHPAVPVL